MSRENVTLSKEIHDVLAARWEGFGTLAKKLPHRHILAVELVRTLRDETIAVFTVARNGEPVKYLVVGDAHGNVKSIECHDRVTEDHKAMMAALAVSDTGVDPASVVLGLPPVKQPSPPGIVAVGGSLLGEAFDVGEFVDSPPK